MVVRIDVQSGGVWNILFPQGCDFAIEVCNEPANRRAIEYALQSSIERPIQFQFVASNLPPPQPPKNAGRPTQSPTASQANMIRKYLEHPLVKSLLQSIEGEIIRVDSPSSLSAPHFNGSATIQPKPTSQVVDG